MWRTRLRAEGCGSAKKESLNLHGEEPAGFDLERPMADRPYNVLFLCTGNSARSIIVINSGWNGAYPSAFINVVWIAIALYGVLGRHLAEPSSTAS